MSSAGKGAHAIGVGVALAMGFVALATAVGGPAWAADRGGASGSSKPNVTIASEVFHVANGTVRVGTAKCPSGTTVFGGAWGATGQHTRVMGMGPSRKTNGYLVWATMPPANLTTGITKEISRVTVFAWCAPVGQPIVLGKP